MSVQKNFTNKYQKEAIKMVAEGGTYEEVAARFGVNNSIFHHSATGGSFAPDTKVVPHCQRRFKSDPFGRLNFAPPFDLAGQFARRLQISQARVGLRRWFKFGCSPFVVRAR
jgi:hypothetical protein